MTDGISDSRAIPKGYPRVPHYSKQGISALETGRSPAHSGSRRQNA
jgi:hypothetical protein